MKVKDARFLLSATAPKGWPPEDRPEIAFAGRSNVGKSSLVNSLTGRRTLARVSGTPGRTRTLNFIDVDVMGTPERLRFVDLPGYGYAKVSKSERRQWGPMIEGFVRRREPLALVVVIVDARHPPSTLDAQLVDWLREIGRPHVVVATKVDKLSKSHRIPAVRGIAGALGCEPEGVLGFSSESGEGRDALWRRLLGAAQGLN